jgi:hypothetical protein
METYIGNLLEGEYQKFNNQFFIKQIKNIPTESTLTSKQIETLTRYLGHQISQNESCIITVNDQLPIQLSKQDASSLHHDLTDITSILQ